MANIKSAEKKNRQHIRHEARNRAQKSEMRTVRRGFVTFPVQVPARPDPVKEHVERADIAALRARLQELGEQAKTEAERRRERVAEFLAGAEFRLQSKDLLDQMKANWTGKVRQRDDLSEAERKERLEDIEDYFAHLEDQLKPYL